VQLFETQCSDFFVIFNFQKSPILVQLQQSFDKGLLLASGFLRHANSYPERDCLHINGVMYSYADIQNMAEIVFGQLVQIENLPPFIGIYLDDSVWTYATIIAISAAGCCYVPLNPLLPGKKIKQIIREIPLALIVTAASPAFEFNCQTLIINQDKTKAKKLEQLNSQDFAYLLFTSGSTGEPKGVPVSHKNVRSFLDYMCKEYQFNSSDRFLQPYELSFDVSVFSIFAAWECGAAVYVVPSSGIKYLNIASVIRDFSITVCSMVPSVLHFLERYLPEFSFPHLRYSFFSGDRLYYSTAAAWKNCMPNGTLINCYGPTETTIVCSSYIFDKQLAERESLNDIVPIGRLFPDHDYLVVDEHLQDTSAGELCISGPQVIEHYLQGRNEESFFERGRKRFYRTGDICSLNEAGNLLFHGRSDSQFKINGYRIEAAEVEKAILLITGRLAFVIDKELNGSRLLVAFVQGVYPELKLREELQTVLPAYMIPGEINFVREFPMNVNGKIDKIKLRQYGSSVSRTK
jgi:D-alanine--poly(phosphoribitol) ligase subunit 1